MKKILKGSLSVICCIAILISLFTALPLRSLADNNQVFLRIEGKTDTYYSGEISFTAGNNVDDILKAALDSVGKTYTYSSGFLSKINNEPLDSEIVNYYPYWSFYYNGEYSSVGMSSVTPKNGDTVTVFLDWEDTLFPSVTFNPQTPVAGQNVTIHVTGSIVDWSNNKTITPVANASVDFNGTTGKTNSNGDVIIKAPTTAGNYTFKASKYAADGHAILLRTGDIPVTVGNAPVQPTGGSFDMQNSSVPLIIIDDNGGKAAVLTSGFNGTVRDSYSRTFTLQIPAGTIVSGSSSWDGTLKAPTPVSYGDLVILNSSIRMAVEAGNSQQNLTLSDFAKIILPNQSGKKAGYFDAAGTFHEILKLATNVAPSSGNDGYFDDTTTNSLIIYTKHFSKFISYLPTVNISLTDSLLSSSIASAATYLSAHDASDWTALVLNRAGVPIPTGYLTGVAQILLQNKGDFTSATTLAKTVIGLRAAGADPTNFNGINLVQKLYNYPNLTKTGANGPIFALLALDSGHYIIPADAQWNSTKLISEILGYKNGNGFTLDHSLDADTDITAMAVTALSAHLSDSTVQSAVNDAIIFLSAKQSQTGGYIAAASTQDTSESVAQVIIALSSAGVDPATDIRFTKSGGTPLSNLMSFRKTDGTFEHTIGGGTDIVATQQSLLALEAYSRFLSSKTYVYDLTNIAPATTSVSNPKTGSQDMTPNILIGVVMLIIIFMPRRKIETED